MKKVNKNKVWGLGDGMGWVVKGDFNSDVDVAVVADGVSVFHIKQPHFVSNDSLALGWRRKMGKRGREDTCPTFPRQVALHVGTKTKAKEKGGDGDNRKEEKGWCMGRRTRGQTAERGARRAER